MMQAKNQANLCMLLKKFQNGIQNLFMGFQLRESDTTYCVDKAN